VVARSASREWPLRARVRAPKLDVSIAPIPAVDGTAMEPRASILLGHSASQRFVLT
jgi:hypothetical protein